MKRSFDCLGESSKMDTSEELKRERNTFSESREIATNEQKDRLTPNQIVRLASAISADNMESMAEGYLDLNPETVKNIRRDASNSEAFNRDVIRYWANKNPDNQVQVRGISFNDETRAIEKPSKAYLQQDKPRAKAKKIKK